MQGFRGSPSVVVGESVACSNKQLLSHGCNVRAGAHQLHQGIGQLPQVRAHLPWEGSQQVGQEGDGLDLRQLEVHEHMPAVISHLLWLCSCLHRQTDSSSAGVLCHTMTIQLFINFDWMCFNGQNRKEGTDVDTYISLAAALASCSPTMVSSKQPSKDRSPT